MENLQTTQGVQTVLDFGTKRFLPQSPVLKKSLSSHMNLLAKMAQDLKNDIEELGNIKDDYFKLLSLEAECDPSEFANTFNYLVNSFSRQYRKFSGGKSDMDKVKREIISLCSPQNVYYTGDLKSMRKDRKRKYHRQFTFIKDSEGFNVAIPINDSLPVVPIETPSVAILSADDSLPQRKKKVRQNQNKQHSGRLQENKF